MDGGTTILERERELEAISRHLDAAGAGDGSLLVVEGPAGIGKTTLIAAARELAANREMRVLRARGSVLEANLEYGAVRQLLEGPVLGADPERQHRLVAGPATPAGPVLGLGEAPPAAELGVDRSAEIRHALYWLTVNLAEQGPLLWVVDDVQWADAASLQACAYVANRLDGLPVAMLVGVRQGEPSPVGADVTGVLAAVDPVYLRPEPLSLEATGTILRRAFGDRHPPERLIAACRQASGGNPFFVTELAAELAGSGRQPEELEIAAVDHAGPPAVRRSMLLRLGRLGEDARCLAQAIAVLGGEGSLDHAAAIAGLELADAGRAADGLAAAAILDGGRPLRFSHPLVHKAITDEIPASELALAHRHALEVLRAAGKADDAVLPHALNAEATGDPELSRMLTASAERALRSGSAETAAIHLRRSLAEPPAAEDRGRVLAMLGDTEVRRGAFADGIAHLDQAAQLATDPSELVAAQRGRAFATFAGEGIDGARDFVDAAIAGLGERDSEGALQLEADLALLEWLSGAEHRLDIRRHDRLSGATRAERTILGLLAQEEQAGGAHPDVVIELAERALGGGRMIAEDTSESLAWYLATYALLACEALDAARETIADAIADGHRRGSAFARAGALGCRSVLALNEGRPLDAEADARAAAAGGIPPTMANVNSAYIVMALVDQGDLDGAEEQVRASGIERGPGGPTVMRFVPWARARLHEARGDLERVRADVAPLEEDDRAGAPMRALAWRALLARALARAGDVDEARRLAADHLEWAGTWGRPAALGIAQRAGALAAEEGARVEAMAKAVETLAGSSLRTEEARARTDLGVMLLRTRQRRVGREALEAAFELALECGARGTARAAATELEIAGAPRKRLRFDELTASERRVAEHAAAGMSNREIAQELFVTAKTVENHLTRVYAKLGVGSRGELAGAL